MTRKYLLSLCLSALMCLPSMAGDRLVFGGLPLTMNPTEMADQLQQKGLHMANGAGVPYTYRLMGRIAGLELLVDINYSKDTLHINHVRLSTLSGERTVREVYRQLMQWMQQHYGKPSWESFVRSHPFARWYVDFDRDIVLIGTAKQTVEVYFYANHQKRNIDYYAILKYCEKNPVEGVPHLTAHASVTWKSDSMPKIKKKPSKRQLRRKAKKMRSRKGTRVKHRRPRRSR